MCKLENLIFLMFKFGFLKYVFGNNIVINNKIKVNLIFMWSVLILGGCFLVIGMFINNMYVI